MQETRIIMGMPVEIEIVDTDVKEVLEAAFAYLVTVDERFSTYKEDSEIPHISNKHSDILENVRMSEEMSEEMKEVFKIAEKTKKETNGYFDIYRPDLPRLASGKAGGSIDPSGIVKGWAIKNTAALIRAAGHENYFVNAGGDIAMGGKNADGKDWSVGIKNPFNTTEIVKVVYPKGKGIATSGSYIRGDHIYNPHAPEEKLSDIVSLTVIGPDVLEADRFATAAFAMGRGGIVFIEKLPGFEAYAIDANGIATLTSGFGTYI